MTKKKKYTYDMDRFRSCIEREVNVLERKAAERAVTFAFGGTMPKRKEAQAFRKTERYRKILRQQEEELDLPRLRACLKDGQQLRDLAQTGKYASRYQQYCDSHETKEERIGRLRREAKKSGALQKLEEKLPDYLKNFDYMAEEEKAIPAVSRQLIGLVKNYLMNGSLVLMRHGYSGEYTGARGNAGDREKLTENNLDEYVESICTTDGTRIDTAFIAFVTGRSRGDTSVAAYIIERDAFLRQCRESGVYLDELYTVVEMDGADRQAVQEVQEYFTPGRIWNLLSRNQRVRRLIELREFREALKRATEAAIMNQIPDNVIDLYPAARQLRRSFTLHIGPTNSGKTYEAVRELKEAGSGVYLGPLRLLAFEQFEGLNADGYPCTLLTGEERIVVEGAHFTASTIEMADMHQVYTHAVIDEAQMVTDPMRGGAWTTAILGLLCEHISLCASPDAEELLIRLIELCGDEYQVIRHERKVPLEMEIQDFIFPEDVRPGDALIVFSKRSVHGIASELQRTGVSCSIVYGDLPYSVRHEEAAKFASGQNPVIVATDAIGMGMNLPIRRVVFLETSKYDGKTRRPLLPAEIKQIAGRAGRYGRYDIGYVASAEDVPEMRAALKQPDEPLARAILGFPETLISIDGKLSETMVRWMEMQGQNLFDKTDLSEKLELCRYAEQHLQDKRQLYNLITLPFDMRSPDVMQLWQDMVQAQKEGKEFDFTTAYLRIPDRRCDAGDLPLLETAHKMCDLIFAYCNKYGYEEEIRYVMEEKAWISSIILEILKRQKLQGKTCRYCGRRLPWNFPYGVCNRCRSGINYRRRRR